MLSCPALGCEYKCQASPTGGACYCPEGRKIGNDSKTCIGQYQNIVFRKNTKKIVFRLSSSEYDIRLKRPSYSNRFTLNASKPIERLSFQTKNILMRVHVFFF